MALKKYVERLDYLYFKNNGYGKTKWTSDRLVLGEIGVKEATQMEHRDAIIVASNSGQLLTMYKDDILIVSKDDGYLKVVSKKYFDEVYIANAVGREQRFWPQDFECLYENYIYATQFKGKITKDIANLLISEKYRYDKKEPVRKRIDMISNDIDEGNFLIKQPYRFSTMEEGHFKSRYTEVKEKDNKSVLKWLGNNLEEIADALAGYCVVLEWKKNKLRIDNISTKESWIFGIGDSFETKKFKTSIKLTIKDKKKNGN